MNQIPMLFLFLQDVSARSGTAGTKSYFMFAWILVSMHPPFAVVINKSAPSPPILIIFPVKTAYRSILLLTLPARPKYVSAALYTCLGLRLHRHRVNLAWGFRAEGAPNAGPPSPGLAGREQIQLDSSSIACTIEVQCSYNGYLIANKLENFPKRSCPSNLSQSATVTCGAVGAGDSERHGAGASEPSACSFVAGPRPFALQCDVVPPLQAI